MASGGRAPPAPSGVTARVEVAARALVQLIARELSATPTPPEVSIAESAPVSVAVRAVDSVQSHNDVRVRQAMRRQFPSMFSTDHPRGKKRFPTPAPCIVKRTDFHIYVLSGPTLRGSKETSNEQTEAEEERVEACAVERLCALLDWLLYLHKTTGQFSFRLQPSAVAL
ncbi:hypothetical protein KUCAC02_000156 [Chaenocephalus aceratus]|uniref:Uncharacterized protein n=1 Tax=Chaenocephalus aceratus TaxID=36190 RepID=A0ACB9W5G0_CHAAC|nr:hypothetical protein KUCAC02_000156 [Chaenocephalus aceratus]